MKTNTCPVCNSKKTTYFLTAIHTHGRETLEGDETFQYKKCSQCNTLFIPDISIDKKYYKAYYTFSKYTDKKGILGNIEKTLTKNSLRFKNKLLDTYMRKTGKKRMRFLDIGCGKGEFLASLDAKSFEPEGIELNDSDFNISKNKKLTVYNTDILQMKKKHTYDGISLWHVIEHIKDPQKLFEKISSLLSDNGYLFISTPNPASIGFSLSREKWFHLDAPRHLVLFEEKGIEYLSHKFGFTVVGSTSQTYEFPFDLFWSARSSKMFPLILVLYPLVKYFDKETKTYVLKKSS